MDLTAAWDISLQPDVIVFLAGAGLIVLVIVFPLAAELGKRASAGT